MSTPLTFAEKFCARFEVAPQDYSRAALERTLHRHASVMRPIITWFNPGFFAPDTRFITEAGLATSHRDFGFAAEEFQESPANRRFLRRALRLCVSTDRLHRLFLTLSSTDDSGGPRPKVN